VKAVILAGGKGTRLRPLTLHTPKPIVPILDRPFLGFQIDLLKRSSLSEVILSLSYQPRHIEEIFGDGNDLGVKILYTMEPDPLGTAGAVKKAEPFLAKQTVVFNGDVLCDIDLGAVFRRHQETGAKVTIVLAPVDNPSAYGLVDVEPDGRVRRFLEKPSDDEITCNTINAGIYVLEPEVLRYIPPETNYSFERGLFPALLRDGIPFYGYVHRGYWIDIGTPEKYLQVHEDILRGDFKLDGFPPGGVFVHPQATVDPEADVSGPAFIGAGTVVKARAHVRPFAVISKNCWVEEGAMVEHSVLWSNVRVGAGARIRSALIGRNTHVGRNASVENGVVLGDKSVVTDYSRLGFGQS
jgi:NDP-sugar pyrophosphorylase family protein